MRTLEIIRIAVRSEHQTQAPNGACRKNRDMSIKEGNSDRQPAMSEVSESERENPIGTSTTVLS